QNFLKLLARVGIAAEIGPHVELETAPAFNSTTRLQLTSAHARCPSAPHPRPERGSTSSAIPTEIVVAESRPQNTQEPIARSAEPRLSCGALVLVWDSSGPP